MHKDERDWRAYLKSLGHEFFGWESPSANDLIPSKDLNLSNKTDLDVPIEFTKE